MSYGKPTNQILSPSFGQSIPQPKEKVENKKPDRLLHFIGLYRLNNLPTTGDKVIFLPGQYKTWVWSDHGREYIEAIKEYKEVSKHYYAKTNKTIFCPRGVRSVFDEPCQSCDIFWQEYKKKKENKDYKTSISKQQVAVFNLWSLSPHVEEIQKDQDGKPKLNKDGEPYKNWVPISPQKAKAAKGMVKEGHLYHIELSNLNLGVLQAMNRRVQMNCHKCGSEDSIESLGHRCKKCAYEFVPANADMDNPEVVAKISRVHSCPNCGTIDYPEEMVNCTACGEAERRMNIFDVVLDVGYNALGAASKGATLVINGSRPKPKFSEAVLAEMKPKNLDEMYKPHSVKEQSALLDGNVAKEITTSYDDDVAF